MSAYIIVSGRLILNCSICLEDMEDIVTFGPCCHQFCLLCTIQLTVNRITTCALCRTRVTQYSIDIWKISLEEWINYEKKTNKKSEY